MKKSVFFVLSAFLSVTLFAQSPQSFKYQAVIRDATGLVIPDQNVGIRISILQGSVSGPSVYTETHSPVTNSFGLVNLEIGGGSVVSGNFAAIPWGTDQFFVQIELDETGGTNYQLMGVSQLLSVPYALYAEKAGITDSTLWKISMNDIYYDEGNVRVGAGSVNSVGRLQVMSDTTATVNDVIFSVQNAAGDTVFAVYQEGVRIWVSDDTTGSKATGSRGGFAVGGFSPSKSYGEEFLRVTPDSVRIYIKEETGAKATGSRGGFAVGGLSPAKTYSNYYFNIEHNDSPEIIDPSQPRMLWYPYREAFRSGRVLIEDVDSVGLNSMATGFESKAIGDYSQAFGYKALTRGINSTSIGNYSIAQGTGAFAFGDSARAYGENSYAFGHRALATGIGAFAIGSYYNPVPTQVFYIPTQATGESSVAIGMGTVSSNTNSMAFGVNDSSSGDGSIVIGRQNIANSDMAAVFGTYNRSSGMGSICLGNWCQATNTGSFAIGSQGLSTGWDAYSLGTYNKSYGNQAFTIGTSNTAYADLSCSVGYGLWNNSYSSFICGTYNIISGTMGSWVNSDPLFVIGNGNFAVRSNAITVLKNAWTAIGHDAPTQMLDVNGNARFRNIGSGAYSGVVNRMADGTLTTATSDARLKKNIQPLKNGLEKIEKLQGVTFNWKDDKESGTKIGFIAQDVQKILPELVFTNPTDGYMGINYAEMTAVLTEAVKEQQNIIRTLEKRIKELESKNKEYDIIINTLSVKYTEK